MLFLSPDSGMYCFGDFRAQGINAVIVRHNSWFKLRLAMSDFSATGHWMNMKKKKEGEKEKKRKEKCGLFWGDISCQWGMG